MKKNDHPGGDRPDLLDNLAFALSESQEVDWDTALDESTGPNESRIIRNLKLISAVGAAHRRAITDARGADLPFLRWGHLALREKIGEGSYGEVFRAHDETLGRDVALKLFPPDESTDPLRSAALIDEARRLARVRHENVVRVYGAEVHRGRLGFWMELIPGKPLDEIMRDEGPQNARDAARIGLKVAEALVAVHEAQLLHRDVKASNVVRGVDGNVYLMDFGSGVRSTGGLGPSRKLAGTPFYMAPEIFREGLATVRSDIYSLGVLLFHLVSGRYPVEGSSVDELVDRHHRGERVPFSEAAPLAPKRLRRIVERCLDPDPLQRHASARELAAALGGVVGAGRRPWLAPAAWAGVAALTLGGAWLLVGRDAPGPRPPEIGRIVQLTTSGRADVPVWSPDGRWIAYNEEYSEIWVSDPAGGGRRKLLSLEAGWCSPWGWAPDSRAIIANSERDVFRLPLDGTAPDTLVRYARFGDVSPDGRYLAYADLGSDHWGCVSVLDLETGVSRVLSQPPEGARIIYKPKWSPDQGRVAFVRWNGSGHDLWIIGADGTGLSKLESPGVMPGGNYVWEPDGTSLLCGGEHEGRWGLWRFPVGGNPPVQVIVDDDDLKHVTRSPDGRAITATRIRNRTRLGVLDLATGSMSHPVEGTAAAGHPSFTPAGGLLFQRLVNGRWQTVEQGPGEEGERVLLAERGVNFESPRETRFGLLCIRSGVGSMSVFGRKTWARTLALRDGASPNPRLLFEGMHVDYIASSVEHGGSFVFVAERPDSTGAHVIGFWRPGGDPRYVDSKTLGGGVLEVTIGRKDGEAIVLLKSGTPPTRSIMAIGPDRSPELLFQLGDVDPGREATHAWIALAPDRRHLALVVPRDDASHVYVMDLENVASGPVRSLALREAYSSPSWSPDATRLALELESSDTDVMVWWLGGGGNS